MLNVSNAISQIKLLPKNLKPVRNISFPKDSVCFKSNSLNIVKGNLSKELTDVIKNIIARPQDFKPAGEGVKGVVYKVETSHGPVAVKMQKIKDCSFENEAEILEKLPDSLKKTGQNLIAYIKHPKQGEILVTNFVKGSSKNNGSTLLNEAQLKSLFSNCIELDKKGILHGDVGLGNWLIDGNSVNLIDYEASQFFKLDKFKDDCLPPFVLPSNIRTFEVEGVNDCMAEAIRGGADKKQIKDFFTGNLKAKADFHSQRASFAKQLLKQSAPEDSERIAQGLEYEKTMADALKNPTPEIEKIEKLKTASMYSFGQVGKSHFFQDLWGIKENWNSTLKYNEKLLKTCKSELKKLEQKEAKTAKDAVTKKYLETQIRCAEHYSETYKDWAGGTLSWLDGLAGRPADELSSDEKALLKSAETNRTQRALERPAPIAKYLLED